MKPESSHSQGGVGLPDPAWLQLAALLGVRRCPRPQGARPLHFRSSSTDSGCLFSISLRLSSSWTPSVGRRRFWTKEGVEQVMHTSQEPPFPSPCHPGLQHWDLCFSSQAARIPAALSFTSLSSASREDGTWQLVSPTLSPWSAPPRRPSRSHRLQWQKESSWGMRGLPQFSPEHLLMACKRAQAFVNEFP